MERCDFCSVTTILREYISESQDINQTDFLYLLFDSFFCENDTDSFFDNAVICRWMNGISNVSPQIIKFYAERDKQSEMISDIEQGLLPKMYDSAMAVQKLYELVSYDTSISAQRKQSLLKKFPCNTKAEEATLIADVLCFCLERPFNKRDSNTKKLIVTGNLSPALSGYIFNSDIPKPCRFFCGRDQELSQIHEKLKKENKLFLNGVAGIGKSELAKAYSSRYKKEYTNILYMEYSGSLFQDIVDLDFADDIPGTSDQDRFRSHNRFLRSLREDTLIVIDNFNTTATADNCLPVVMKYHCQILFTTRSIMEHYPSMQLNEIADKGILLHFMENFYSEAYKCPEILEQILDAVHSHTLAVELAARLLGKGIAEPTEVLKKLLEEKTSLDYTDKISISKDGRPTKNTYYGHIHTLFSLFKLSEEQQNIMSCMALFPLTGISYRRLSEWLRLPDMNAVNDLIEIGLIIPKPGRAVALHPMIQEISVTDLRPSIHRCHVLCCRLQAICLAHGADESYHKLVIQTIENIISLADKDELGFYLCFLEDAFPYMQKYQYEQGMRTVLLELQQMLENPAIGEDRDRALLCDYEANFAKNETDAIRMETEALDFLPEINTENAGLVSNIHSNLAQHFLQEEQYDAARTQMETGIQILEEFDLLYTNDCVVQITNYASLLCIVGEPQRAYSAMRKLFRLTEKFLSKTTLDYANMQEIMGYICMALGKADEASEHFTTVIEIYQLIWEDEPDLVEEKKKEINSIFSPSEIGGKPFDPKVK